MDSYLKTFRVVSLVALGFSIAYLLITIAVWWFGGSEAFAQIGDAHGFLNALFSGLALAGVVVALMMQTEELRIARLERQESLQTQKEIAELRQGSTLAAQIDVWKRLADNTRLRGDMSPDRIELAAYEYQCRKRIESSLGLDAFNRTGEQFDPEKVAEDVVSNLMLYRTICSSAGIVGSSDTRAYLAKLSEDLSFNLSLSSVYDAFAAKVEELCTKIDHDLALSGSSNEELKGLLEHAGQKCRSLEHELASSMAEDLGCVLYDNPN
ncbi:hypothetical protein Poly51_39330 [Rubripirellula tenax]|uniref:Uncharacterized protein n=1 Tax=Rubripirellula tenax TaxID=2528015 RepID=A0A5C6EQT0_9BACT|nr:hypothetical protein [Rubripirellula tenax]TWU50640.1 hypothetical protein Poly51_39330 [Rubripirellula tenax]